jgi:hypothetical protein
MFIKKAVAARRFNVNRIVKAPSSWDTVSSFSRWSFTWRCVRAPIAGELEAQNPAGWKIFERNPRVWN